MGMGAVPIPIPILNGAKKLGTKPKKKLKYSKKLGIISFFYLIAIFSNNFFKNNLNKRHINIKKGF